MSGNNLPERQPKRVAIYIGPGAKNTVTHENLIVGYDTAIEDHGESSVHIKNAVSSTISAPQHPVADLDKKIEADSTKKNDWHEKPIGKIGISLVTGLLLTAALWAVGHYF